MSKTDQLRRRRGRASPSHAQTAHRAAGRLLDVLELLLQYPEGLTLTELSVKLEVPKSSLLELLRTLTARDYLEQTGNGQYRLGPKALEMGLGSLSQRELPDLARPLLTDLMEKSSETVFLGVLASNAPEIVYIDKVESRQAIRYTAGLGERRPLHCTAIGKAVLAFLPADQQDEYLRSANLVRFTDPTVTDRQTLRSYLARFARAEWRRISMRRSSGPPPSQRRFSIGRDESSPPARSPGRPPGSSLSRSAFRGWQGRRRGRSLGRSV